jgi:two-component system LytT family sensor kinase
MDTCDIRLGARQWVWIGSIWVGLGLFDALETVFIMRSERMHHAWLILFATISDN